MKTLKKLFLSVVVLCTSILLLSQNYITVDHNGTPSLYDDLQTAVDSAQSGDHIYIPGGSFNVSTLYIDKKLSIIGAGHYPDSTLATNYTNIQGNIKFKTGSDSIIIEGLYITGSIYFGSTDTDSMYNISIIRCNFENLGLNYSLNETTIGKTSDNFISENIIRNKIYGGETESNYFEKNIVKSSIYDLESNNCFTNNIFLNLKSTYTDYLFNDIDNTLFTNNIILDNNGGTAGVYNTQNCTFNNNLLVDAFNSSFSSSSNNVGTSNIENILQDSIFINQSGITFSYDHNYHLKPTCPGVGAGDDGTDIGIYGTGEPYKEGAVPSNPHIRSFAITVQDNNLDVQMEVAAQNR